MSQNPKWSTSEMKISPKGRTTQRAGSYEDHFREKEQVAYKKIKKMGTTARARPSQSIPNYNAVTIQSSVQTQICIKMQKFYSLLQRITIGGSQPLTKYYKALVKIIIKKIINNNDKVQLLHQMHNSLDLSLLRDIYYIHNLYNYEVCRTMLKFELRLQYTLLSTL